MFPAVCIGIGMILNIGQIMISRCGMFLMVIWMVTAGLGNCQGIIISASDHGIIGDGKTDVTFKLRALIDSTARQYPEGFTFLLDSGRTYSLTDSLALPQNVTLVGRGATLLFQLKERRRGLCLQSGTKVQNLIIHAGGARSYNADGSYGTAICIGNYATGEGFHDIVIDGVTASADRRDGDIIIITGDSHDITLRNITIPPHDSMSSALMVHWGRADTSLWGRSGDSSTYHPHNITVENWKIAAVGGGAGLVFSGCFDITCRNIEIGPAVYGVRVQPGDWGYHFADRRYDKRKLARAGHLFEHVSCEGDSIGFRISGEVELTREKIAGHFDMPVRLERCVVKGGQDQSTGIGIALFRTGGVVVDSCDISGFRYGLTTYHQCYSTEISRCRIHDNGVCGISISYGAPFTPHDNLITHCDIYANGGRYSRGDIPCGIRLDGADRTTIDSTLFGASGAPTQQFAVYATRNTIHLALIGNRVITVKDTTDSQGNPLSAGFFIPRTDQCDVFKDNRASAGIALIRSR
jgi:hypothetical protein